MGEAGRFFLKRETFQRLPKESLERIVVSLVLIFIKIPQKSYSYFVLDSRECHEIDTKLIKSTLYLSAWVHLAGR